MKRTRFCPLWVTKEVHHRVKLASVKHGVPISKLLGEMFGEDEPRKKGGFRGIF
jgi:hypothetical protein